MLETLSEFFYDPLVFWTAPLVLVALAAGWRKVRAWRCRAYTGTLPDDGSGPGPSARDAEKDTEKG